MLPLLVATLSVPPSAAPAPFVLLANPHLSSSVCKAAPSLGSFPDFLGLAARSTVMLIPILAISQSWW